MPTIYRQSDFSGGLNAELDPGKVPMSSYPFAANVRVRSNVLVPVHKHRRVDAPEGNYQGLYAVGSIVAVFISGNALYQDISDSSGFRSISGWTLLDTEARIHAELCAAGGLKFNREITDNVEITRQIYNESIASFPAALHVQNGIDRPRAILPDASYVTLGDYAGWTKDRPVYVPIGKMMTWNGVKLFLADKDLKLIFHSVSGRPEDFVVNIDTAGEKGGDATTVATAVSFNDVTAIKAGQNGIIVTTLFSTHLIQLDYSRTIFGEPNLIPVPLFPVGCVNDRSFFALLGDIGFISQTGVERFNLVQQVQTDSNNFPIGAKIRRLLANPQTDTAATNYDAYALMSMATVHGRGVFVYDTTIDTYVSLDLSFGAVTQFALAKTNSAERLFFITADNEIFEAFADEAIETAQYYTGEFTAGEAGKFLSVDGVDLIFTDVNVTGTVKVLVYIDGEIRHEEAKVLEAETALTAVDEDTPFNSRKKVKTLSFQLKGQISGARCGILVQWNADAALSDIAVSGDAFAAQTPNLIIPTVEAVQKFAFVADTGYGENLGTDGGCLLVSAGRWYLFNNRTGPSRLAHGNQVLTSIGKILARSDKIYIDGTGGFLADCTDVVNLVSRIQAEGVTAILGGGDHCYESGLEVEAEEGFFLLNSQNNMLAVAGNHDYDSENGLHFFAQSRQPRYYSKRFDNVEFFFYNGGYTSANVGVDDDGVTAGPTSEPDGNDIDSLQAAWLKSRLATSPKRFKFVIVHESPYGVSENHYPGVADLRLPFKRWGAHAVFSGHDHIFARQEIGGLTYYTNGLGGRSIYNLDARVADLPQLKNYYNGGAAYGLIEIDGVSARIITKTAAGVEIDRHTIYA